MAERSRRDERQQPIELKDVTPNILKGLSTLPDSCISLYSFCTTSPSTGFSISVSINTGSSGEVIKKGIPSLSINFFARDAEDAKATLDKWQDLLDRVGIKTVRQSPQTRRDLSFSRNVHKAVTFDLGGFAVPSLPPWKSKIAEFANVLTKSSFGTITKCVLTCRGLNSAGKAAIREQLNSANAAARSPRVS